MGIEIIDPGASESVVAGRLVKTRSLAPGFTMQLLTILKEPYTRLDAASSRRTTLVPAVYDGRLFVDFKTKPLDCRVFLTHV